MTTPKRQLAPLLSLTLLVSALLSGCTGTEEPRLPTLLIIGFAGGSGPALALVEDLYDPGASPARSLVPVAGSERPLPAPPVSLDVVDRTGSRSELVVLVREDAEPAVARLHFFGLSGLDPSAPATFARSRDPLDLLALLTPEIPETPPCLTEVQVGSRGRYAALLDDGACRPGGEPEIHVVDLRDEEHLYSLSVEFIGQRPLAAGIFVDQATDLLYFAAEQIGDRAEVRALPLSGSADPTPVGAADLDLEAAGNIDLAAIANGIGLLADDRLALVPLGDGRDDGGGDGGVGGPAQPVATLSGARWLLPDPTGSLEQLVTLAPREVAIHEGDDDADPERLSLRGTLVDATLEPVQLFAYLLQEEGVTILDLFPYAEAPGDRRLFRELDDFDDPRVIGWAYSAAGAGPTP